MPYFLTTARLGFRTWEAEDISLATEVWGDPQVTRFLGGPFTSDWIASRLKSEIALQRDHGIQYWPVFLLETGAHVGCCGLRPYQPSVPELGFHLRPEYWGRGLAAEAAGAVIEYAFGALGARAVFAGHLPDNDRSRRALLKAGFEYDGMKVYPPTGLLEPTYLIRNNRGLHSEQLTESR
ncbi:MAG TPA: GNAT family N-acetyltransferase [Terracidiphilus sp.]|jgi:RimJ/RimL family protein N-acetyltransferase